MRGEAADKSSPFRVHHEMVPAVLSKKTYAREHLHQMPTLIRNTQLKLVFLCGTERHFTTQEVIRGQHGLLTGCLKRANSEGSTRGGSSPGTLILNFHLIRRRLHAVFRSNNLHRAQATGALCCRRHSSFGKEHWLYSRTQHPTERSNER